MRIVAVSFLLGVGVLQMQPSLGGREFYLMVLAGGLGAVAAGMLLCGRWVKRAAHRTWLRPALLAALAFVAGFGWAGLRAEARLGDALAGTLEGVDVVVRGRIASLPQAVGEGWRFVFEVEAGEVDAGEVDAGEAGAGETGVPQRLLLSWYPDRRAAAVLPALTPGERWQFVVRLKRPHGFANPSGFDYEAWLLERGVRATGYVRADARLLEREPAGLMQQVHRLRAQLRERMLAALVDAPHGAILVALGVGDQQGIRAQDWAVFRRTGIGHLVSISGLHVALVGLLCGGGVGAAWRRIPALALRLPAQKARAVAALAGASAYALLAGMGIPVLRAWLMLAVVVLAMLSGRAAAPSRVLAIALFIVLVVDPWAVLAGGFWLSFGAVTVILACTGGRLRAVAGWRAALRIQLALSVALIPLLLALFQSFPLVSPLANLFAVPLVSFVITPLVLAALLLPMLLVPAHAATVAMMAVLERLAALEHALWEQAPPPPWLLGAGLVAVGLLLLPRATPGRLAAPALLLALLSWQPPRPAAGAFRAVVLDVGQGLAVHVQTRSHELLFDAGPAYGGDADAGGRVVLPYLRATGVRRLDALLLSHEDIDHVGGAVSVLDGIAVGEVMATEPDGLVHWAQARRPDTALRRCAAGQSWFWDGVRFDVLHPASAGDGGGRLEHDNNRSCVLRVWAAGGALLLTGDIEAVAERAILARHGAAAVAAEVVVSAHHGSRSSSSPAFVEASRATAVIHSAGHRNAFGHPHAQVRARWAAAGARNWRTDSQGAVEARFAATADEGAGVSAWRDVQPRYWHGR
ncbi:DNA internalization-related competence protein ComEC/Rec2 [Thauera chlorobenzoica]|uniref:DNA internalization-related competence protein ComEC/Rec2 n=1 Tax=Thauera chlorobenzoica TaxID=96773 RepID=UPI00089F95A0|nr:DNA internalization-related competence protein ComEC/Rec2 [Thauera chlorobenzoica]SEF42229.1 competence protein ComEC [Thauera chlorobenzoica]